MGLARYIPQGKSDVRSGDIGVVQSSMQRRPLALGVWNIHIDIRMLEQRSNIVQGLIRDYGEMQNCAAKPIASVHIDSIRHGVQGTWSVPSACSWCTRRGSSLFLFGAAIEKPLEGLEILCLKEGMEQGHKYVAVDGTTEREADSLSTSRAARVLYSDFWRTDRRWSRMSRRLLSRGSER